MRKITEVITYVIQSQNAYYLVPLCDAAYVRKKTDQHISPSERCNDDSVFVSRSKQLFGWCMYNKGKGHRPSMAHPEHGSSPWVSPKSDAKQCS